MKAYLDRWDYQYLEMHTDLAYITLAGESLELVKEDKKEAFAADKHQWFLGKICQRRRGFDKR